MGRLFARTAFEISRICGTGGALRACVRQLERKKKEALESLRTFLKQRISWRKIQTESGARMAKSKKPQQPALPGTEFPDWWPTEAWQGFVEMRTAVKAPLTDYAIKLLVRRMTQLRSEGNNPQAVFDQSVIKCYTDIYPVKDHGNHNGVVVAFEQTSIAGWIDRLSLYYEDGKWSSRWAGCPPKNPTDPIPPACKCPPAAFESYRESHRRSA